jgi:predicted nucleic-acid-binding protein
VIALDTNVLVRLVTGDDAAQARRVAARIDSGDAFFVPLTVALELEWVLRGAYKLAPDRIVAAFEALMSIRNLRFADDQLLTRALNQFRAGLDFADALHLEAAQNCSAMLSLDAKFRNRTARAALLPRAVPP